MDEKIFRANKKYEGKTCNICNKKIDLGEFIQICSNCQCLNHEECWRKQNGCINPLCNNTSTFSQPTPKNNEVKLPSDMFFCQHCKEPMMKNDLKCKHCGEYQEENDFQVSLKDSTLTCADWIMVFHFVGIIAGFIHILKGETKRGLTLILYSIAYLFIASASGTVFYFLRKSLKGLLSLT